MANQSVGEMATTNNEEDFITCGVCLLEYDEEIRKPKYLPCSHTFCLPCLQDIKQKDVITCPFCRKTISKDTGKNAEWILPNNTYALQMLRQKGRVTVTSPLLQDIKMDALIELKEDILKMRDTGIDKLGQAIQKRKEVQQHLALITEAINVAGEEAKKVQDANNFCLEEMVAAVSVMSISKNDPANLISELMSLVQDSAANDSVETFKQKIKKSAEKYEQQLVEATEIASEYELRQKTKIHFDLLDEKDVPIQTLLDDSPLLLLSHHCLLSLLQKQKKVVHQSTSEMKLTTSNLFTSTQAVNSDSFYMCRWRKFILRFHESGKLASEIHIRPAPTFHPQFVKELADFCHESPMNFSNTIQKVMPGVFILIPMSHPQFQPAIRSMNKHGSTHHNCTAEDFDEVGITSVKNLAGKVIGWSFVFVLEDYEDFQNRADHLPKSVRNNEYFGDVIHHRGLETVSQLSKVSKKSKQTSSFTFSLEYQFFF